MHAGSRRGLHCTNFHPSLCAGAEWSQHASPRTTVEYTLALSNSVSSLAVIEEVGHRLLALLCEFDKDAPTV